MTTKQEAIQELEDLGYTVPEDWTSKQIKDLLDEVKRVEEELAPTKVTAPATWVPGSPRG